MAKQPFVNELRVDLQASGGMNPWTQHDSGSREQMLGGHLSQALVVAGATIRRCMTGAEREFGRFTFNIKMPCNGEIIKGIEKYPRNTISQYRQSRENPLYTVIYKNHDENFYDILHLPTFHCRHQHFGFRYKFRNDVNRLMTAGSRFRKGTIFADSPAVDEQGNYKLGVETNVAFMSIPQVIEDGVVISESYAEKLSGSGFESREASWGENYYPLNLYGDENEYKPFPDIGQRIRPDGLLMCLRKYDDLLGPIQMTPAALREVDPVFDHPIYAVPNALVVDVSVRHDNRRNPADATPVGMEAQTQRYHQAESLYHQTIVETYEKLRKEHGVNLRISPQLHAAVVTALSYSPDPAKMKVPQMYRLQPLDDWRVEVTFEVPLKATVGYKLTDFHGGKGVVCDVWPDANMPVDAEGNRADCIMDGDSTIKRMNIGRMYEQYINATSRHVTNQVRAWLAADRTAACFDKAWEYIIGYYKIVSPKFYDLITGPSYTKSPQAHVEDIIKDGVYLWLPPDNPVYTPDMIQELSRHYPIHMGPVTYTGRSGNTVVTKNNVLIGSLYVMLLEKTSTYDWSGVASAKLNHHGIAARLTSLDRYASPGRPQPVRISGESEVRLFAATIGGYATAHLLDMSNNPVTHKAVVAKLLRAENPTRIDEIIDRSVVPMGQSRALLHVTHHLQCAGMEFYYSDASQVPARVYQSEEVA